MVTCVCARCDVTFQRNKRQMFCSSSCAAIHNNARRKDRGWSPSQEQRNKTAKALRGRKGHNKTAGIPRVQRIEVECPECKTVYMKTPKSIQKYCNISCAKKNMGGFRERSGSSRSGYYKGVFCASTYELAWVVDRMDNNLSADRFVGYVVYNDDKKYYPDFIDGKMIYEIKGWVNDVTAVVVKEKCEAAIRNGYNITVLYKSDIKPLIKKITTSRGISNIECLYDEYKPKIEYTCKMCGVIFGANNKRPRRLVDKGHIFCSKKCGRMHAVSRKQQMHP